MTNKQLARALKETAALLELSGANPFRTKAFQNAARTLERLEDDAAKLLAAGTLTEVRGIGQGLAAQIQELVDHGSFELRDELLEALPPGLPDLLRVPGLGPKKVRALWQERGLTTLDALEAAAEAGHLTGLAGFGAKTQANIVEGIRRLRRYEARRRYADALVDTLPALEALRAAEGVKAAELAGPLRRKMETVDAADMVVAGPAEVVQAALAPHLDGEMTRGNGAAVLHGTLADGLALRVHLVPAATFGTDWWRLTGSEAHRAAFRAAHGAPAETPDEAEVYRAAGLPPVEPELREGRGELEAAARKALPDLITVRDLRGSLHNHSTYSDGAHTLRAMADAARAMGLEYFGICDHSRTLAIAHGLSIERVAQQHEEVKTLNEAFAQEGGTPFRIFAGIESDILDDGSLDYPDDVLASFDLVVASVHSGLKMTKERATERVVRAVENPYTTILGHPTGRLLLRREGYPLDMDRVLDACAACGVAVELNANPYRLDLDWRWVRAATERGVLVSINPDAHATDQLAYTRWGVEAARKGWLTAAQCLNAMPLADFEAWLQHRSLV